jgi:hypothetical protein
MVERFVDRDGHVLGLGQADQRAVAGADGDFGLVAVLLDSENDFAIKSVAQNFADFCEAGFNFFADAGSNYEVSASVFHVHERPLVKFLIEMNWALHLSQKSEFQNAEIKSLPSAFSTLAIFGAFLRFSFYFCLLTSYFSIIS